MLLSIVRLIAAIMIAVLVGKLVSKIKLPAILGWLIVGMLLGPHALNLVNTPIFEAPWYQTTVHFLECVVGLLIGTELVTSNMVGL